VERALFLNRLDEEALASGLDRLYFGAEFCPWTFPDAGAITEAVAEARRRDLSFTLATPVLAEAFLPRLRRILEAVLPCLEAGDEVLVSDWGALALVREVAPGLPLILGRVLSGQKRGPQLLDLDLTAEQLDYFRRGSWYAAEAAALLAELGVARVELDNLLQGVAPLPAGLAGSLHYPFIMVTSSRNCPFREGSGAHGCAAECGEAFTLTAKHGRLPLLQCGNTQFLSHDRLPDNPASLGIDRLVRHPFIPC
jgi:hypothetical protein